MTRSIVVRSGHIAFVKEKRVTSGSANQESVRRVEALIAEARGGSPDALGRLLEFSRNYLLQVANAELDSQLQAKAGGSDLVQETFLEAQRIFARFQGTSEPDLLAWLRAILLNKVATFTRHYRGTGKRQVGREVPPDDAPPEPAAAAPTPSLLAMQGERAEAVAEALGRLPEHYRQVIVWRQWDELSFEEIARRLQRSPDAARMVWCRAIERLQQELDVSS
jgi:RNA polymerase sigma-70 factor (ECF subfamily)